MATLCLVLLTVICCLFSHATPCTITTDGKLDMSGSSIAGSIDATVFAPCSMTYSNITEIDLRANSITGVDPDTFLAFYNIKKINLAGNNIRDIDNSTFTRLTQLEELDISNNSLTKLEAGMFDLYHLRNLYLQNNSISSVEMGTFNEIHENLVHVNLNYNSLTQLDPWPYLTKQTDDLRLDRTFDLQHNHISEITNSFGWTYNLSYPFQVYVNLQFNELTELGLSTIRLFSSNTDSNALYSMFYSLNINGTNNPYICDCKLYGLAEIIQTGILRWRQVERYVYRCGEPAKYANEDWYHYLPLSALVCNRTDDCPPGCYCEDRPHNDTFYINCNGAGLDEMPDKIPSHDRTKIELILDNNHIKELKNVSYMSNIYNLSLSNNSVKELGDLAVDSLANVSHLDLSFNAIENLPKDIQRFNYGKLRLAGNPLRCDCDSLWMSEWLKLYQDSGDASLTCTHENGVSRIIDLTLEELSCTYRDLIIILVCVGLVLGSAVAIFAFSRVCPYETKVIVHKLFRAHPSDKYRVDTDHSKELDIYLIFDWDNADVRGWIRHFQKKLQVKKPLYSILNPCRFSMGGAESEGYTTWICKARRVIIVLSKELLDGDRHGGWQEDMINQAENNIAEAQARQNADEEQIFSEQDIRPVDKTLETAAKIIYIVYNKDKDLEKSLNNEPWKSRLSGKTVLTSWERMFWSKLRYELPATGNGEGDDGNFLPPHEDNDRDNANAHLIHDDCAKLVNVLEKEEDNQQHFKKHKQAPGKAKHAVPYVPKRTHTPKGKVEDDASQSGGVPVSRYMGEVHALASTSANQSNSYAVLQNIYGSREHSKTNRLNIIPTSNHKNTKAKQDNSKRKGFHTKTEHEVSTAEPNARFTLVEADVHSAFQSKPMNTKVFANIVTPSDVQTLYSRGPGDETETTESLSDMHVV